MRGRRQPRRHKSPSVRPLPEHLRYKKQTGEAIDRAHGFAYGVDIALVFRSELDSGRISPKKIVEYINRYKVRAADHYYLLGRFAVVFGNRPELMQAAGMLKLDQKSVAKEIMAAAKAKKLPREVRDTAKEIWKAAQAKKLHEKLKK
ncbi:MAG: hypothetical protein NT067_01785 [Candidatus Diapherotrites archaeon]|nr:hypothetical protein [Candidatus Diapherotrites archaeon]